MQNHDKAIGGNNFIIYLGQRSHKSLGSEKDHS